jgi:hypothetical protein
MSQAKDTVLRLFALLRLIPAEPQRIANPKLFENLREKGFSVTLRSIQRDLDHFSIPFLMRSNDCEIPLRWSFTRDALQKQENMGALTALALNLSESHPNFPLPQTVLHQLSPNFVEHESRFGNLGLHGLAHWARRVLSTPNGIP